MTRSQRRAVRRAETSKKSYMPRLRQSLPRAQCAPGDAACAPAGQATPSANPRAWRPAHRRPRGWPPSARGDWSAIRDSSVNAAASCLELPRAASLPRTAASRRAALLARAHATRRTVIHHAKYGCRNKLKIARRDSLGSRLRHRNWRSRGRQLRRHSCHVLH